jgi:hypothetical protein
MFKLINKKNILQKHAWYSSNWTLHKSYKKKYSVKYVTGVNQIMNGMYGAIIRSVFLFFYMWKWGTF